MDKCVLISSLGLRVDDFKYLKSSFFSLPKQRKRKKDKSTLAFATKKKTSLTFFVIENFIFQNFNFNG